MNFPCTTAAFTLSLAPDGLRHLVLTRPGTKPSMRFLSVGSHVCAQASFRHPLAGLPLPSASSYSHPQRGQYRYSYRGLAPHQFMPMPGVHNQLQPDKYSLRSHFSGDLSVEREMRSEDSALNLSAETVVSFQRTCDLYLRRGRVLLLCRFLTFPAATILAFVAAATGVYDTGIGLTFCLVFYLSVLALDYANDSKLQRVRDAQAEIIVNSSRRGIEVNFALYLRGDVTDNQLEDMTVRSPRGKVYWTSEKSLANAIQPIAPLIAIGGGVGTIGAGRAFVRESKWREVISLLLERAKIILFIPWHTGGVIWEANEIARRSLFAKTIFIMPKVNPPIVTNDIWKKAQTSMHLVGLQMPEYEHSGMYFTLDQNGKIQEAVSMPGIGWRKHKETLACLLRRSA